MQKRNTLNPVFYLPLLFAMLLLTGCDISENKIENEAEQFHKIFNTTDFDASFVADDIEELPSGGYVILQESSSNNSNFKMGSFLVLNESGDYINEVSFPENTFLTCPDLLRKDSLIYAIGNRSNGSVLLTLLDTSIVADVTMGLTNVNNSVTNPMAASIVNENEILISGVNIGNSELTTEVCVYDTSGAVVLGMQSYGIGSTDDGLNSRLKREVNDHINRSGRYLPFFAGQTTDGLYFFNGLKDFALSMIFSDLTNNSTTWEVQGQQTLAAVTGAVNLNDNNFAISRFNTDDNYLIPSFNLPINLGGAPINSANIDSLSFPEIQEYAKTRIKVVTVNEKEILLFGTTTRDNRIILIAYDPEDGRFLGSNYYGFSVPHAFGDFIQTKDNGLAIVGTALITGRFERVSFFKISAEELSSWVN